MRYDKEKKVISCWVNSGFDRYSGYTCIFRINQFEGFWGCPVDFHPHWSSDRPFPVHPSGDSLLLFPRNHLSYSLQAKGGLRGVAG